VRARAAFSICMVIAACGAQAAELATLFTTPEERARLDRMRRGEPEREAPAARGGGPPVITGFVKRSDGRSTVWIDGTPMVVSPDAARLLDPRAVRAYSESGDEAVRIERKAPR
jgi:hypothetical protein